MGVCVCDINLRFVGILAFCLLAFCLQSGILIAHILWSAMFLKNKNKKKECGCIDLPCFYKLPCAKYFVPNIFIVYWPQIRNMSQILFSGNNE